MNNPICAASRERADKLDAAGCPIDYPDALPRLTAAMREPFHVELLPGYVDGRVYELGPLETGYVIPLKITSNRSSGTIINDLDLEPQWPDHFVNQDCEPEDIIPKKYQDAYKGLSNSPLMKVLNEGHLIRRGHPVEGLLCGRSYPPIGESFHGFISAKLRITDLQGNTVVLPIDLTVYGLRNAIADRLPVGRTRPRVFELEPLPGALDQRGKTEEAVPDEREMLEMASAIALPAQVQPSWSE